MRFVAICCKEGGERLGRTKGVVFVGDELDCAVGDVAVCGKAIGLVCGVPPLHVTDVACDR